MTKKTSPFQTREEHLQPARGEAEQAAFDAQMKAARQIMKADRKMLAKLAKL